LKQNSPQKRDVEIEEQMAKQAAERKAREEKLK
jgi:hypothetical protein